MEATGSACKRRWLECCHLYATSTTCSVCWTSLSAACLYIITRPDSFSMSLQSAFRHHEQAKKREYDEHVCEVKHGVFTPLVLSSTGSFGREATTLSTPGRSHQLQTTETLLLCNQLAKISPLNCHPTISNYVCQGQSLSYHCPRCEVNITLVTKTPSLWVYFYLLGICLTSFLSFCLIIQTHCITQFTLYTGINI